MPLVKINYLLIQAQIITLYDIKLFVVCVCVKDNELFEFVWLQSWMIERGLRIAGKLYDKL